MTLKVTVEPFIGNSVLKNPDGSNKPVRFDQYRVRVDGMHAGFIGFAPGSKLMLTLRFSPIEIDEIEKQVAGLVGSENQQSVTVPDVPAELLNPDSEDWDDDDEDDFNP